MLEHVVTKLFCRPGITGAATLVFAREGAALNQVPKHLLQEYHHAVVLPAKRRLDSEYMARTTFFCDFKLIFNNVMRQWDMAALESLIGKGTFQTLTDAQKAPTDGPGDEMAHALVLPHLERDTA